LNVLKTFVVSLATMLLCLPALSQVQGPTRLTVGVQESGTVQWEIETIRRLGLDQRHGVELEIRPLADSRAGQIALQAGAVDVILSDFVWVAIQRAQGNALTMVPHSLAVGGLMVPPGTDIASIADLEGKTIGVAGGPVDKSWVILQAYYRKLTGGTLIDMVQANYGAPPLINELLASGGIDAALNFWQWNARAKASGAIELLSVADMLSELGVSQTPPLLGWTFTDAVADQKGIALRAFLEASFEAKQILLSDAASWESLRDLMGAGQDDALFGQLRDDYRAGIVSAYDPNNMQAAEETFALLAEFGGSDLVGDVTALPAGTFWPGFSH
jgi:NitT/TauT family transport system substrate-binding protein